MNGFIKVSTCLLCFLFPSFLFAEPTVVEISASDIPSNLRKAEGIKLVGEWGSEEFSELPLALGTSGLLGSNNTLVKVDMSEAKIKEGTSLSKSGISGSVGIFLNCKKLATVIMPDAENAARFADMTKAFQNCVELSEIDLSNCTGVKTLNSAFYGCAKLKEADLSKMILSSKSALTEAFANCESLVSVKLPADCQMANSTFKDCMNLLKIDWTTYSGELLPLFVVGAFEGISDLSRIQLWVPESRVAEFKKDKDWSRFTIKPEDENVIVSASDIPSNLRKAEGIKLVGEWGSEEFSELPLALGTSGLLGSNNTLVKVDMSEAKIKEGTSLSKSGISGSVGIFLNCKKLATVIMPDAENAARFADMTKAFQNCVELSEIDLSNCTGVKTLNSAFYGCAKLKEADLSKMILSSKSALTEAFANCESLVSVKLPADCQMANSTFKDCMNLLKIDWTTYSGELLPLFVVGAFEGISDLSRIQLWVPESRAAEFKRDRDWSRFTIMSNNNEGIESFVEGSRPIDLFIDYNKVIVKFNRPIINTVITICEMNGNCVLKELITSDQYLWNTQNCSKGIYLINTDVGSVKIFLDK